MATPKDACRASVRSRLEQDGFELSLEQSLQKALVQSNGLVRPGIELQALVAANLLEEGALGKALPGLAAALRTMATELPADPTEWLVARLKASRPVLVREYTQSVLKAHVMKCDEFEDIHLLKTERPHPQACLWLPRFGACAGQRRQGLGDAHAWNFRRTDAELPIFGSGQCHLDGIEFLARHLKQDLGFAKVLWFNMREEPVVFLDGKACAPRTDGNLNENVEYLMHVEGYELDAMERRLRSDCAEAAAEAGGTLGVYFQKTGGSNVEEQLAVPPGRSHSVREAYETVRAQPGMPDLTYFRVPITDETAPDEADFDQLVSELRACALAQDEHTALVFNCQMGRGRTTTGMVCGSILLLAARGWRAPADAPKALPAASSEDRNLVRGEYKGVLQLLALMDEELKAATPKSAAPGKIARRGSLLVTPAGMGLQAKLLADECIDACAHAQNMVEAVSACQSSAGKAEIGAARSPEFWLSRARNYLERYASILLFAAYALQEAPGEAERVTRCRDPARWPEAAGGFMTTYSEWSHRHWHFKRVMKHLALE